MSIDQATLEEWDEARRAARSTNIPKVTEEVKGATSDGGSSSYYTLPEGAKELDDLIMYKRMPWPIANIFKACYRFADMKNDKKYEANKILWFAERTVKHLKEGLL